MRLLNEVLRPCRRTCDFVVSVATYLAQVTKHFLMAFGPPRNKYMVIPAKLARCLQALDMPVFAQADSAMWQAPQARTCRGESGRPSWELVLALVVWDMTTVLRDKSMARAFGGVGVRRDLRTSSKTP